MHYTEQLISVYAKPRRYNYEGPDDLFFKAKYRYIAKFVKGGIHRSIAHLDLRYELILSMSEMPAIGGMWRRGWPLLAPLMRSQSRNAFKYVLAV